MSVAVLSVHDRPQQQFASAFARNRKTPVIAVTTRPLPARITAPVWRESLRGLAAKWIGVIAKAATGLPKTNQGRSTNTFGARLAAWPNQSTKRRRVIPDSVVSRGCSSNSMQLAPSRDRRLRQRLPWEDFSSPPVAYHRPFVRTVCRSSDRPAELVLTVMCSLLSTPFFPKSQTAVSVGVVRDESTQEPISASGRGPAANQLEDAHPHKITIAAALAPLENHRLTCIETSSSLRFDA